MARKFRLKLSRQKHLRQFQDLETDVVGDDGSLIVPVPEINVQIPVPTAGVFPAKVAVVEQMV